MQGSTRIDELRQKFHENPRRYFAPLANEYRKAGDPEQAIAICRAHLAQQTIAGKEVSVGDDHILLCLAQHGEIVLLNVVAVFVVPKDPNLTAQQVIDHAKQSLTGYKVPKHVHFRKELPKTNVGKILRRALRDELSKAG